MPLVDGPDCRLWVEAVGDGDPVTIFAHGITSSSDEIAYFATQVPGTRVLFDFRGHGRSESPPEEVGYDYPSMRRDLEFVADRYGAARAMGVSMGAGAILNLLADRPDRFERLVFFLPARIGLLSPAAAQRYPALAHQLETHSLEEVAQLQMDAPESQLLFEARPAWRHLILKRVMRMNATGIPRALRAFVDGRPPLEDPSVLKRVTAPTYVLSHENDPIHPAEVARRLAELIPNAELRIWEQTLQMLDDPMGFARDVGSFLAGETAAR